MKPITLASTLLCLALPADASAQGPFAGHYIVSSFKSAASNPKLGDGGVFFVHPGSGIVTPVTGLPAGLTGKGRTSANWGANCVARNAIDSTLAVGEVVGANSPLRLYILTLKGSAVTNVRSVSLGTTGAGGQVSGVAVLPGGDILFSVAGVASGPLTNVEVARFSPRSNTLSIVLQKPPFAGIADALTIDATGTNAFVGVTGFGGSVWQIPLTSGSPRLVASFPRGVNALARDAKGQLIVGLNSSGRWTQPVILRLDPTNGKGTPLLWGGFAQAVAVERATGGLVMFPRHNCGAQQRTGITWMSASGGTPRRISCGPTTGWGFVSGIDVYQDPETFGASTPTGGRYVWDVAWSPAGLPSRGNVQFGLRLVANGPVPSASVLFWSGSRRTGTCPPGLCILLKPPFGGPVPFTMSRTATIALPIPGDRSILGIPVHFQSFHNEGGRLAASNGVTVTPL